MTLVQAAKKSRTNFSALSSWAYTSAYDRWIELEPNTRSALVAAKRITQALFSGDLAELSADDFAQLAQDGMPSSEISEADIEGQTVIGLLVDAGMAN